MIPAPGASDADELARLLRTGAPIVVVESHEEAKVLALAERLARHANRAFYTWSVADGLVQRSFTYAETARGYDPAGGYVDGHAPADCKCRALDRRQGPRRRLPPCPGRH